MFCVYKMRLEFTVYGQAIHFGQDVPGRNFEPRQHILFFHERQAVLCESAGQYWDAFKVSRECSSGSKGAASPFPPVRPGCWGLSARHCEFAPQTRASALILCQTKGCSNGVPCLTLLYQEIDELLPNPRGCSCIFLFLSGS